MIYYKLKNLLKIELNPNRIFGLDILRAIAILLVVGVHGVHLLPPKIAKETLPYMMDGVSLFFVLSGYLIGGILIKLLNENKNQINFKLLKGFWIRRWFRTVPNYFLILFILVLLNTLFTENFKFSNYTSFLLFAQNLFTPHPSFFPEAWSLSVEEWFYLLTPIGIFIAIKKLNFSIKKSVLTVAMFMIVSITVVRIFKYYSTSIEDLQTWDLMFRKQVLTRLDSLMYGIIGAYIAYYYKHIWHQIRKPAFVLGLVLFSTFMIPFTKFELFGFMHSVLSFSLESLATLLVLPYLSHLKKGKGIFYKPITYISLISYSMYLVNLSIVQSWILGPINWPELMGGITTTFLITRFLLFWFSTVIISILLYKYFEIPMMNVRDRYSSK